MPPPGARIMGGLPDSAREQLRRFMEVYDELVKIGSEVNNVFTSTICHMLIVDSSNYFILFVVALLR